MGPTTSRRQRPAKGRPQPGKGGPIRGVRLKLTLSGAEPEQIAHLARQSGLDVARVGGRLSVGFEVATTQEALDRLKVLSGLLAAKA